MKKRVTITIDPEVHEWLKRNVTNISKFLETLAKHAKHQIEPYFVVISPIGVELQEIKPIPKVEAEEKDLKKLYLKHRTEFEEWMKKRRKIEEDTVKKYLSAIDRLLPDGVKEPKDLDRVAKTKDFAKGLRNFLNFLEDQYYQTELFGFDFDVWRRHLKIEALEKKEKEFATTEDIVEAYKLVKEKWKDEVTETLFKLLFYSGQRLEHAYEMLKTFDPGKLEFKDKVALYPTEAIAKGHKRTFYAFMPKEFAQKLKKPEKMLDVKSYTNRLDPSRWKPPIDNPTSAKTIRAWFQTFAFEEGLRREAIDFIVGHVPQTVAEKHYLELKSIAVKEYEKLANKLISLIPP